MTVEHLLHQDGIRSVALGNKTVCNQIGRPHTETYFMSVQKIPAIFLDDIAVEVEQVKTPLLGTNTLRL